MEFLKQFLNIQGFCIVTHSTFLVTTKYDRRDIQLDNSCIREYSVIFCKERNKSLVQVQGHK